jgi:DNA-binding HxlR family transcriptional regulator
LTFRKLQSRCEQVSPTLLNRRLTALRDNRLVALERPGGYRLTPKGEALGRILLELSAFARGWIDDLDADPPRSEDTRP